MERTEGGCYREGGEAQRGARVLDHTMAREEVAAVQVVEYPRGRIGGGEDRELFSSPPTEPPSSSASLTSNLQNCFHIYFYLSSVLSITLHSIYLANSTRKTSERR